MNKHLTAAIAKFNAKSRELIPFMDFILSADDFSGLVRQPSDHKNALEFISEVTCHQSEFRGGMALVIIASM